MERCFILYHYRDPIVYHEILEIIADLKMKKVAKKLNECCIRYAIQIDGSMDKQQLANKLWSTLPQNYKLFFLACCNLNNQKIFWIVLNNSMVISTITLD